MFRYELSDADRERIAAGGPLNVGERVIVEHMLYRYFAWVTGNRPVRIEWSRETDPLWWDTVTVHGDKIDVWEGYALYPGEDVRRWVLGYFTPETEEPEPENGLVVDAETADFLSSL